MPYYSNPVVLFAKGDQVRFTQMNVTRYSYDRLSVAGTTNKYSNVYAVALADGASAPSSATVKATGTSSMGSCYFNIDITGLTADTAYDVYVVAEDINTVLQVLPTKIDITTMINFNTQLGSNLKFWLNGRSKNNKTLSGTWSEIVSDVTTAETTGAITLTNTSSSTVTTKYNGKGLYFSNAALLGPTNKSKLNVVHNGNAFTIVARIFVAEQDTTTIHSIVCTNNASTAKTGFLLAYDNRTATSSTHKLVFQVTKSSAGNNVFNLAVNNFFALRTWTTVTIKYDGVSTLTYYKDGVSQGTASPTNTPFAATDASDDIGVGRLSASTTFSPGLIVTGIVVTDNALGNTDRNAIENAMASQTTAMGVCGKANIYQMNGQSNMSGANTTPPPSPLTGVMKTYIMSTTTANPTSLTFPRALESGVSQNTESTSLYGPELEFGYMMAQQVPDLTFLSKTAVSGSPLYALAGAQNDWNVSTGELSTNAANLIYHTYRYLRFALDRDPEWRGWIWSQGEADSDTGPGNPNYKTDLYSVLNLYIDRLVNAFGYTPSKGRSIISIVDQPFSPSRPNNAQIITAQNAFVTDYFTDNPTYASKWASHIAQSNAGYTLQDGVHFDSTSTIARGLYFYDYFKNFVAE